MEACLHVIVFFQSCQCTFHLSDGLDNDNSSEKKKNPEMQYFMIENSPQLIS